MKRLPLLEEKISKNLVEKKCEVIAKDLSSYYSMEKHPGWMSGLAGISCYFFHYYRYSGIGKYKRLGYLALESIFNAIEKGFSNPSFANGLGGVHWMFSYLGNQGFISKEEANSLSNLMPMFDNFSRAQFANDNYDVLHGALGIYPIERIIIEKGNEPNIKIDAFESINLIKSELSRLAIHNDDHKLSWELKDPLKGDKEINFGLAHGIPSILIALSWIYKITKDQSILTELIEPGMKFLLSHNVTSPKDLSLFPVSVKNGVAKRPSRMAWCYGDPGVATAIHQIGENCEQKEWQEIAQSVLKSAAIRKNENDTGISDACICHGSAGLALIYLNAGNKTGYEPFLNTARYWIRYTLEMGNNSGGSAGYLFKVQQNKHISKYGLLEGISGVGLTLLAVLEGELPGWEKGLMIQ